MWRAIEIFTLIRTKLQSDRSYETCIAVKKEVVQILFWDHRFFMDRHIMTKRGKVDNHGESVIASWIPGGIQSGLKNDWEQ